ncbi:MlaD family protein [Streptomyces sp. B1866]|uniref:MlaD family protein n=1 Tax=Streptomyces sp. B1866 TaxID=3075431 RepID=UPI0028913D59|nr:MlaD family protein [Streptomyces sp. B1866]MDT3397038.1 MlaD family protein [Streptomyces sp. B1866]
MGLGLTVGSCGAPSFLTVQDIPLPGGADLGSHPYEVTAEFSDVLSLVPQSAVKVNDVDVGRVTKISIGDGDWTARVTMRINGKVRLPANAWAHIEQTSLLGEKYVQLSEPPAAGEKVGEGRNEATRASAAAARPVGRLADGAVIPLARTDRTVEVEQVFGAMSMLFNGGGVQQIQTISRELNKALSGNEGSVRSLLQRINETTRNLDDHKTDITDALDSVNRLASTLATRKQKIDTAVTGITPALKVLEEQRGSLVTMLNSIDTLSDVAVNTVNRSKDDMVADLRGLAPTLRNLANAGQALPDSLQVLLTYPFTDEVLNGIKGDYLNVFLRETAAPGTRIIPPISSQSANSSGSGGAANPASPGAAPFPLPSVTAPEGENR